MAGNMYVRRERRPLDPEKKVNMSLDEIINYERKRAGVSHKLQFCHGNRFKRNWEKFSRRRTPFFFRKKYRSQNWRLRNNGPKIPNFNDRLQSFLKLKWKSTPPDSVFQRLGYRWNGQQAAARAKLRFARNHRPFLHRKQYNWVAAQKQNRLQKLIASSEEYHCIRTNLPVQKLNKINLQSLAQALGGNITSVKEVQSDTGTITTTITRVNPDNSNFHRLDASYNSTNDQQFDDGASYTSGCSTRSNMLGTHALAINDNHMAFQPTGLNYYNSTLMRSSQQGSYGNEQMMSSHPINEVVNQPSNFCNMFRAMFKDKPVTVNSQIQSGFQNRPVNSQLQTEIGLLQQHQFRNDAETPPPLMSGLAQVGPVGNHSLNLNWRFTALNNAVEMEY